MTEAMDIEEPSSVRQRVSKVVLPGDDITDRLVALTDSNPDHQQAVKIGHGINCTEKNQLIANVPGEIISRPNAGQLWVNSSRKRYFPRVGDKVVGIVEDKGGDFYVVNIFSGTHCILHRLSFEGATKRNKPELKRGDLVYAVVQVADRDRETELSCINTAGARKDWSSGETVVGPLSQGLLLNVSTGMARRLLRPDCVVTLTLGK
jgi:exosome complex component RRP40